MQVEKLKELDGQELHSQSKLLLEVWTVDCPWKVDSMKGWGWQQDPCEWRLNIES